MTSTLLIPSARLIPAELQGDFGRIPSCMIPFGGVPALGQILSSARGYYDRAVVACHLNHTWIEDYLVHAPCGGAASVDVGPTRSLGETLLRALDRHPAEGQLMVHFGDTLIRGQLPSGDAFLYADADELYRWTMFQLGPDGRLEHILEKETEKEETSEGKVFVGVFTFADGRRFRDCLEVAVAQRGEILDPFYAAAQTYYNAADSPPRALKADQWIDLGHMDSYFRSRRLHAMGQRAFNAVSVDPARGILTKRSRNEAKFADEILWYLRLPPELSYLAPRVFSHSLKPGEMSIDMEFFGYPPLSDIFLFGCLDLREWEAIFERLAMVLEDMGRIPAVPQDLDLIRSSLRSMYCEKTIERLHQLAPDGLDPHLLDGPLRINGRSCLPLRPLLKKLPDLLRREGLLNSDGFTVIHGDFCLSNLLFDRRSQMLRLVDPRGRFGAFDVFGDPRYDLAKLSHCFNGHYDFLVHGLFSLESPEPDSFHLNEFRNERHRRIQAAFNGMFLADPRGRLQVRAIEFLLFLSMVPLHADRPRSQTALLLRGLETASELFPELVEIQELHHAHPDHDGWARQPFPGAGVHDPQVPDRG